MRIALCFSGQIRTGVRAAFGLKKFIGDLYPNCDLFMHTWDISTPAPWRNTIHFGRQHLVETSDGTLLAKLMDDVYDNKFIYTKIDDLTRYNNTNKTPTFIQLWYSWQQSILLKQQAEIQNGCIYDIIVKIRPDMVFPEGHTLLDEINIFLKDPTKFYNLGNGDIFFLSNSETMDIAANYIVEAEHKSFKDFQFYYYLESKKITVHHRLGQEYTLLRDEVSDNDINDFKKCDDINNRYYTPSVSTRFNLPETYKGRFTK